MRACHYEWDSNLNGLLHARLPLSRASKTYLRNKLLECLFFPVPLCIAIHAIYISFIFVESICIVWNYWQHSYLTNVNCQNFETSRRDSKGAYIENWTSALFLIEDRYRGWFLFLIGRHTMVIVYIGNHRREVLTNGPVPKVRSECQWRTISEPSILSDRFWSRNIDDTLKMTECLPLFRE